ncbi:hypothetical protein V1509DRAFT_630385 [Lipomyces kononenkoae]
MDDHEENDVYPAAESSTCQASRASLIRNDIWDYVYDADDDDDRESSYVHSYHHGSVGKASTTRSLLETGLFASHNDSVDENDEDNQEEGVDMSDLVDVDVEDSSASSSGSSGCEQISSSAFYPVVSSAMLYDTQEASNNDRAFVAADGNGDQADNSDASEHMNLQDQSVEQKLDRDSDSVKSWNVGDDGAATSPTSTNRLDQRDVTDNIDDDSRQDQLLPADMTDDIIDDIIDDDDDEDDDAAAAAATSAQNYSDISAHYDSAAEASLSDSPNVHALDDDNSEEFQPSLSNFFQDDILPSSTDAIIAYYFNESDSSDSDQIIDVFRTNSLSPSPPLSPPAASPPHYDQMRFLPAESVEDQARPPLDRQDEGSMKPPEALLTPTGPGQARHGTGSTTTRVSSVGSVSSGSSHTSYENAATYRSASQGIRPLANRQTLLNNETVDTSADMLRVGRTRPSGGRRVFSTISTNQVPDHVGQNSDDKNHAGGKGMSANLSQEQTPTVTKPQLKVSVPVDNEIVVSRQLSASPSSATSDEEKENRSPVNVISGDISIDNSTFRSLRNRRIRPGGGSAVGPTTPFTAVTLKSDHLHSRENNILPSRPARSGQVKNKEYAYISAIRRASDQWRQQLIDGSLARILQHARGAISVATHRGRIQECKLWLSEYIDVVIGMTCTFVIVGATLVGVLSFVDDTGRDYFGIRTMTYECALKSTAYRDVHQCLVQVRLPSIFPLLGVTVSSPVLHWYIITDLYCLSVLSTFTIMPLLIVVTGLMFLSVGYGALAVLIMTERFLRGILGMTKQLMLEQIAAADTITDIIDGTDQKLFGDL